MLGKFTNWEGGTRVRAFVHSPSTAILPAHLRGTQHHGLFHVTDIYPTILRLIGLDPSAVNVSGATGPVPMDGVDQLQCLQTNCSDPVRTEIFYSPVVAVNGNYTDPSSLNPEDCEKWGQSCGGALRQGDFKIVVGYPGDNRVVPLAQARD